MSDAIDHEAEVSRIYALLKSQKGEATVEHMLSSLQAHATMALVQAQREANEQGRIAKLIALMGAEFDRPRFGLPRGSRRDSDYLEVVAEIRKGLGL